MTGVLNGRGASLLLSAMLLLAACTRPTAEGRNSGPAFEPPPALRAAKNLTIAVVREPTGLHEDLVPGRTTSGNRQVHLVAYNYLAVRDDRGTRLPQLAQELISLEKGGLANILAPTTRC